MWSEHFTMADNPNLPPEFIESQKRLYTGFFYKRFIEGLWVVAEGAIYKDSWSENLVYDLHDEPPGLRHPGGHAQRIIPVDYGTTNPMVFLDIYDDGQRFWVAREYYWDSTVEMRQKTDAEYADDLAQFIGPQNDAKVIVDPSAASFKAEMTKRHLARGCRGTESGVEKRAAILIGPEFGTVTRPDLVEAAREAGDADFDVLIACAFNYEARATEFSKLGRMPVLKARMNADLHMSDDLKNTGKGNLFVIFGEPDIEILAAEDGKVRVKVNGVDVFHPNTGEVRSDSADGIACWFIDTDYNEESFFVRHAYFLGANDPYSALKTTLKTEINLEAWQTLNSDTSRAFPKPTSGRIAVKVINHLGDEVMKVFKVA